MKLTVAELINVLSTFSQEYPVVFTGAYGAETSDIESIEEVDNSCYISVDLMTG